MRNIYLSFCFMLLIFLTCCFSDGKPTRVDNSPLFPDDYWDIKFQGTVTDSVTKIGLEGAEVGWWSPDLETKMSSTFTNRQGEYYFVPGTDVFAYYGWYIRATKVGYHSFTILAGEVLDATSKVQTFDTELTKI